MTPSHDGSRTPLHGGAWDPTSANTPARPESEFDYSLDAPTPSPVGVSDELIYSMNWSVKTLGSECISIRLCIYLNITK